MRHFGFSFIASLCLFLAIFTALPSPASAAFPIIAAHSGGNLTTNAVNATGILTMPSGIVEGDLLVAVVCGATDGASGVFSTVTGWELITQDADADNILDTAAYSRVANGTEGSTYAFVGGGGGWYKASNAVTYQVYRITGSNTSTLPDGVTSSSAVSSTPDPPALNPTEWGTEETLWIALVCHGEKSTPPVFMPTITGLPDGFTSIRAPDQIGNVTGFQLSQIQGARNTTEAASMNPTAFALNVNARNLALTIAVRHAEHIPPTPPPQIVTDFISWALLLAFVSALTLMLMGAWWVKGRKGLGG